MTEISSAMGIIIVNSHRYWIHTSSVVSNNNEGTVEFISEMFCDVDTGIKENAITVISAG